MKFIDNIPGRLCEKLSARALPVVQRFVSKAFVEEVCRDLKYCWRERYWSPLLTLLACVHKQLAGLSARKIEDWAAGLADTPGHSERDGHGFCMARSR